MEKFISLLFSAVVIIVTAYPQPVSPEMYFDFNSYLKFSQGTNILLGGDVRLSFSFRFCNDKGILLYQNRPNGYFAIGVSKAKIYVEWKMSNIVVELYIGDGSLAKNQTYAVTILNLNNRQLTSATINGAPAYVEYLIVLDERLNLDSALGEVYIGGFVDISLLPVNTERISAYLTICLDYVETAYKRIDLTMADQTVGVYNSCPADFCAPPTTVTTTTTSSYVLMNVTVKARTRTHISFRFRTRAPRGMLFYIGGPAYLTLFLVDGGYLGLGLNTKAQDAGSFNYSNIAGYNDGSWKYVQIIRTDNVANVTNEQGYLILSTRFGVTDNSGYNLNADSLMIAGTPTPLTFLPAAAQVSTPGCFQAPRFVSFSIASEPASLLNFDTQISKSRDILLDYCYSNMTCYPQCPGSSQYCDLACLCSPGYQAVSQNPLVCTNIDDCLPNPCQNGATCVDLVLDYKCLCTPGFGGKKCDQISYCSSLPCKNGATCTDTPSGFICTCAQGYIGIFCDVDLDECWSGPCKNGATCRNLIGSYACDCKPGFYGINCEFDYNECQTNPCINGGVCVNTVGSFYCSCSDGYTGTRCEQNTNECSSNPCFNNGVCIDGPNSYLCNCPPGFSGVRCEIDINECNPNPCLNNGICTDGRNMFTCSCLPGYAGVKCEINIDECSSNPCRNNGICLDQLNGYRCQCATGYTGVLCENDINECSSNPCKNNGACVDRIGFFQCICPPGWSGSLCEVDVNECLSSPCSNGGTCYNEIGMYRCSCLPGYAGLNCQTNVNECSSNPCYNGGTCTDLVNGYVCNCPPQYAGPNCGDDYNECLSYPCQNGGICNNLVGYFTCTCLPGFTGQVCQLDIDECASSPCLNGGVCQNHVNAYYCTCPSGFVGTRCESNYNECASNPCVNGVCNDGSGSYSCICFPGWQGVRCDVDINECASNPCRNGAACENLQNRYRCVCLPGYEGTNCEINVNDCYIPTYHKCANGATCVDGIGTYTCLCAPGWAGQFCDQDLNECNSSPCQNNGTCTNLYNAFYCTCQTGFTGPTCADDIDECALNVCKNYVFCRNTYGSYTCTCQAGYTGKNCDSVTNPCLDFTCYFGGTCEVINNAPHCLCLSDYMGVRCEAIIRQCNYSYPCKNNAFCQNKALGGYQCFCKPGFSGMRCDINIDECASSPCYNGGSCEDLVNGFKCTCIPGYTGDMCRVDIDECFSQPCQNGGSCTQPMINMYRCVCAPGYAGTNCEQIINNCASNPCQSWQICTNAVNNFTCSCPSGFTGSRCSDRIDKCYSQPCLNGGTCEMIASGDFFCRCPFPWGGPVCDITTDACYPNPCLHFGTCIRNSSVIPQGYVCSCRPGFIGERCQGDIYSCFSNPCKNGAQCSEWFNGTNGFSCGCTQYYTGPFCDSPISLVGACSSSPCLNGGSCYSTTNGFGCSCTPNWVGTRCENDVNECTAFPCLNGGTCTNTAGSFICTCSSGWTGTTCNNRSTSNPCPPNACLGQICLPFENGTWKCCSPGTDCPCNPNPCANGGTCVSTSSGTFKCLCPLGITGDKCDRVSSATFGGNNSLEIPLNKLLSSRTKRQATEPNELRQLDFSFKTVHGEGLILYLLTSYGYLLVELHGNSLRVAAGFVGEEVTNSFPIASCLDGNTISVSIQLSNNALNIILSRCDNVCGKTNSLTNGTLFVSNIQLGLKESWLPFQRSRIRSSESFRGCLENVFINNRNIFLSNQLVGATVDNNPPKPGCQDVCTLSYCQNGGACVDGGSSKSCQCTSSYGGNLCQYRTVVHFPDSKTFNYSSSSPISNISFIMTANDSQGLVFFTVGRNPFALSLENWTLVLIVTNSTWRTRNLFQTSLADGGWYKIQTILTQTSITVSVQSSAVNQTQSVSLEFSLEIPNTIFIGSPYGYTWYPQYQKGFVGCMSSLLINSVERDWTDGRYDKDLLSCPREEGCSKTPCRGGKCTSSWSGFQCDCLPPFTGVTCSSDLAVSYKDQTTFSSITVDASRYSFGRNISFAVKTIKENTSCIMLVQFFSNTVQEPPSAYICVRIANGSLLINTKNDNSAFAESPTSLKVNTGYWTSVGILPLLETSSYIIKMNDTEVRVTTDTHMYSSLRSSTVRIYMGNWQGLIIGTAPFFEGCISRLMFNDDDVTSLVNYIGPPLTTESLNLPRVCQLAECSSSQCSEKGSCFSFWSQTQCVCQQGFTGKDCAQSIFPCFSNQCSNGGTCINNNGTFSCNCQPGWTGPTCNTFDICLNTSANLCKNGTCEMLTYSTYKCKCQDISYGRFCEFYNSCKDNPCLASRNCTNLSNIYSCPCTVENDKCITKESSCTPNALNCSENGDCYINSSSLENYCKCKDFFNGSKCETCNYCLNGGSCVRDGGKLTCNCSTPFMGLRCDTLNPCFSNPCENGSTCDGFNSTYYTCVQKSPFTSNAIQPNTSVAIGLGVGIPLFLLAALAGYLIYKREQRLRGMYKPQETEQNISLQNSRPFTVSNGVNSSRNNNNVRI